MLQKLGISSKPALILVVANLFLLTILWAFTVWRWRISPDFIPLHYTVFFGFDRFGPKYDIFLFPTLATVLLFVNGAVARELFRGQQLWQSLWLFLTLFLQLGLVLSLLLVVLKYLA